MNEVKDGVVITEVDTESAAGKAGLNVEDIITAINGTKNEEFNGSAKVLVFQPFCR